jgi:hypothetical protein
MRHTKTPKLRHRRGRTLYIESLEERRLLSVTVNTLVDENDGVGIGGVSLRDAISSAPSGETIEFAVSGRIRLVHGQLAITKNLTITGPGAELLTIDASGSDPTPTAKNGDGSRVLEISDGASHTLIDVKLFGLSLTGGDVSDSGGAVRSEESFSIINCVMSGNSSRGVGGAISISKSSGVTVEIHSSTISGNSSHDAGGGIFAFGGDSALLSTTTISSSTISGNEARFGGGIYNGTFFGTTTVINSLITGNSAIGRGGGVLNHNLERANTIIQATTISGNVTRENGGGFYEFRSGAFSSTTISSSTISGNRADISGGGVYAIPQNTGFEVKYSTITNNTADADSVGGGLGGGIRFGAAPATILFHTIVAGNTRTPNGPLTRDDIAGTSQVIAWYSLVGTNGGANVLNNGSTSKIGTGSAPIDPVLGPLVNNGGLALTHALLPGSPAIDMGDPSAMAGLGSTPRFDQRDDPFTRIFDGDGAGGARIDIGAYERQPNPLPGDYNFNREVDAADYVIWRKTLGSNSDLRADGSGDGTVDQDDHALWRTHFGEILPSGAGQSTAAANEAIGIAARNELSDYATNDMGARGDVLPMTFSIALSIHRNTFLPTMVHVERSIWDRDAENVVYGGFTVAAMRLDEAYLTSLEGNEQLGDRRLADGRSAKSHESVQPPLEARECAFYMLGRSEHLQSCTLS